jgi:hypothetical protein
LARFEQGQRVHTLQDELDFERSADEALDDALAATFPCSDPIAVSCLAERAPSGPSHEERASKVDGSSGSAPRPDEVAQPYGD